MRLLWKLSSQQITSHLWLWHGHVCSVYTGEQASRSLFWHHVAECSCRSFRARLREPSRGTALSLKRRIAAARSAVCIPRIGEVTGSSQAYGVLRQELRMVNHLPRSVQADREMFTSLFVSLSPSPWSGAQGNVLGCVHPPCGLEKRKEQRLCQSTGWKHPAGRINAVANR